MKRNGEGNSWRGIGRPLVVAAAIFLAGATAFADAPQSDNTQDLRMLQARIAADEAGVAQLQAKLAAAQKSAGVVQVADLFGESDEEKAARLQKEQAQDASIASLNQRMGDLEDALHRLTGQMEELDHRVSEFNAKIDRMQKDFDYKICQAVAAQMNASAPEGDETALPCTPGQPQGGPPAAPAATAPGAPPPSDANQPVHLAPPPGVLGTLPQGTALPQAPAGPGTQTASVDNHAQFDGAMKLLSQAQYDQASAAFRTFADSYPKDDLSAQAIYWIGYIAYVQKDYANAAHAFVEELKKFPQGPRAPESMLKLGQSLIAMNQKKEGCNALAALPKQYPSASKTIRGQADDTRKAAACR